MKAEQVDRALDGHDFFKLMSSNKLFSVEDDG
jgi:hypothetical protein